MNITPLRLPGATLVTRLKVYDTPSPDAQPGGTPHVHLLCTEMYFVLGGSGAVEMMDWNGCSVTELRPQTALVFSPGTLHRLINPAGDLELLVVMQNSGLPERGDNVVTFTDDILAQPDTYAEAMRVSSFEEAQVRRDRGVEGFLQLKAAFERGQAAGREALGVFYDRAAARTADLRGEWRGVVERGPLREARASLEHLEQLERGDVSYLQGARQHLMSKGEHSVPGFCGALDRYFDPASLELEGVKA